MKWLGVAKKNRLTHTNYSDNKKSRIRKWLYRLLFILLLLLFLLMLGHFEFALETLSRVNADQMNMINGLSHKVHTLELHNGNLQAQMDIMKLKINGLEVSHQAQAIPISNITPQMETPHIDLHNDSSAIHNSISSKLTTGTMITTAAMAIYAVLRGVSSLIPAF